MNYGMEQGTRHGAAKMDIEAGRRKPGRPRAIGEDLVPKILTLYRRGLGYRAIARELTKEGVWVDWSTVRRAIKANQGRANENMASK